MQFSIPVRQEHSTISLGNKVSQLVKSAQLVCIVRDMETHGRLDIVVQGGTVMEVPRVTRQLFTGECVNQDITVLKDPLTRKSVMGANFVLFLN